MTWTTVADAVSAICLLLGASLSFLAALGMLRFPDLLSRIHSATKPQVLGLILVLVGVELRLHDNATVGMLLIVVIFQLATSPIASHMVARASFRSRQVRDELLVVDELTEALEGSEEPRGAP